MQVQGMGSQMRMMQEMMRARMQTSDNVSGLSAKGQMPSGADLVKASDTDGNGIVSLSEFKSFNPAKMSNGMSEALFTPSDSMKENMFKSLDTDSNGSLNASELEKGQMMGPPPELGMGQVDGQGLDLASFLNEGAQQANGSGQSSTSDAMLKKLLDIIAGSA